MVATRRLATHTLALVAVVLGCRAADGPAVAIVVGHDGIGGARLAAAEVNRSGGIDGRPLELVVFPTARATSAEASIQLADSAAGNPRVLAVIGHSNSAASLAASQIYNARHLVQIAPTSTAPLFSVAGPYSFRLVPDDRRQAEFLARRVTTTGARRVALLYVNDDYGRALREALRDDLARTGTTVAYETPFLENAERERLESAARAVAAAAPDLVVWIGRPPQFLVFYPVLRGLSPTVPVLASDGMDLAPIYARPDLFVGLRVVRLTDPGASTPRLAAFRTALRASARIAATAEAVLAYDATMLVAAALRSGARTRDEVRDWLAGVGTRRPSFDGLGGPIAFDANGDVTRTYQLAEVRADGVHAVP